MKHTLKILSSLLLLLMVTTRGQTQLQLVKDIQPGDVSGLDGSPLPFLELNNDIYFKAWNKVGTYDNDALWRTDGTANGTVFISDEHAMGGFGDFRFLARLNDHIFYNFRQQNAPYLNWVWRVSQNPDAITPLVSDSTIEYANPSIGHSAVYHNKLYLTLTDKISGGELWVSDGTSVGTTLFKDILPGKDGSYIRNFMEFHDLLYFTAYDGTSQAVWRTDGTVEGTEVFQRTAILSDVDIFPPLDSVLLFSAWTTLSGTGDVGIELWRSDGTEAGTYVLKDILPGSNGSKPTSGMRFGDQLLFVANDGLTGQELWITDGTSAGTQLVKDIFPGSTGSSIRFKGVMNGQAFFTAHDGIHSEDFFGINEMWVTDGTTAGTTLLKDIIPGKKAAVSSSANRFAIFQNYAFFTSGTVTENNRELWITDGTEAGTQLFLDIFPGDEDSNPGNFYVKDDKLYFEARSPDFGRELWVYDLGTLKTTAYQALTGIQVFPTITSNGILQVQSDDPALTTVQMKVFDRMGKMMWTNDTQSLPAEIQAQLWPAGTYFLQLTDPKTGRFVTKVIVIETP